MVPPAVTERASLWQVVRIFAFNNGKNNGYITAPIQDPVGVFHENALKHYDYVLAAGAIGIRLILCLNNTGAPTHICGAHFIQRVFFFLMGLTGELSARRENP